MPDAAFSDALNSTVNTVFTGCYTVSRRMLLSVHWRSYQHSNSSGGSPTFALFGRSEYQCISSCESHATTGHNQAFSRFCLHGENSFKTALSDHKRQQVLRPV